MSAEELFAAVMISERRAAVHALCGQTTNGCGADGRAAAHSAMRGAVATRHRRVVPQDGGVLIALGLALAPAVALGFSRFAYALLLPDMRASLGWSYAASGALNTANAAGYLLGAIAATPLGERCGSRRTFGGALFLSAAALLATAAAWDYATLLVLRIVAGVGGAISLVVGAGLAAEAGRGLRAARAGLVLSLYFGGAGLGIVVSTLIIPVLRAAAVHESWRLGWLVLGLAALAAVPGAVAAARRVAEPVKDPGSALRESAASAILPTVFSYGLFGAGYIIYMTFIVALLGAGRMYADRVALFWTVLGALAAVSAFGWGPLLVRLRGGAGPACVFTTVAVGALFALLSSGMWGALGSAVLFGGAFMAGPASVSVVARRELTPATWQRAFGLLTTVFSIGQIVGPWLAGAISDAAHDVRAGLGLAVGLLVFAALIALGQRHTEQPLTGRDAPR